MRKFEPMQNAEEECGIRKRLRHPPHSVLLPGSTSNSPLPSSPESRIPPLHSASGVTFRIPHSSRPSAFPHHTLQHWFVRRALGCGLRRSSRPACPLPRPTTFHFQLKRHTKERANQTVIGSQSVGSADLRALHRAPERASAFFTAATGSDWGARAPLSHRRRGSVPSPITPRLALR